MKKNKTVVTSQLCRDCKYFAIINCCYYICSLDGHAVNYDEDKCDMFDNSTKYRTHLMGRFLDRK